MKKFLYILLAAALVLTMFAGCGSTAASESSAASAASAAAESAAGSEAEEPAAEPEAAEPAEEAASAEAPAEASAVEEASAEEEAAPEDDGIASINGITYYAELPLSEDNETLTVWAKYESMIDAYATFDSTNIEQYIEEVTGVNLEFTEANKDTERELFNLMVSSGLYCDLTYSFTSLYSSGIDSAVDENIILNLADYLEYAPNYASIIDNSEDIRKSITTDTGNIGAFYAINNGETLTTNGLMARKDWLDALGMEAPTTYDELTEFLAACVSTYGCDKSIIINSEGVMTNLIATFGIACSLPESGRSGALYTLDNGSLKFGPTSDEFCEYLTIMHDWYDQGILYGDYFTNAEGLPSMEKAVPAGRTAVFTAGGGSGVDTFYEYGRENDPEFDLVAISDPVVEGSTVDWIQTSAPVGDGYFSVMATCENVELAMKWCDFWYTEEGYLISNYGIEGESYEMVDGQPVFTDLIKNNPDYTERQISSLYTWRANVLAAPTDLSSKSDEELAAIDIWTASTEERLATKDNTYVDMTAVFMTAEESEQYSAVLADITTYIAENITKFITGDRSLDEYADYVADIESMNIDECISIMQDAYDRYLER